MRPTSRFFITGIVSLLLVLYATMVYLAITTDYRLTISSAERQVATLSGALEQHASRTIGEAESMLETSSQALQHDLLGHDKEIGHFFGQADAMMRKSPQIKEIFFVAPHGKMIANSRHTPFKPIYVGDREYYRYHASHQDLAIRISAPIQSRIDGAWLFTMTRRVNRPDGSLKMIAGVAIEPDYFSRFYQGLDFGGTKGEVTLVKYDGTLLASFPLDPQDLAPSIKDPALFRAHLPQSLQGVFKALDDDNRHLTAFRKSQSYPLVSLVSLHRDQILAPWRIRALRHGSGAIASILLIFALGYALDRRLKRLALANAALVAQKLELELAAHVFEQSQQSIVITDRDGIILQVNRYFTELTGYLPEEAIGQTPRVLKSQRHDEEFYRELWRSLREEGKWRGEIWNRRKDGDGFAALLSISSVRDAGGEVINFIGVIEDITEQKLSSERIYHLAHFDVLTNLPNRRLFNDRLVLSMQQAKRYGTRFAVLFLDLDNFKGINDTLGHHAGDLLLQAVAQRLLESLRKIDAVARFGGDEFAIMLDDVKDPVDVKRVAQKIIEAVSAPVDLEGIEVQIGVSIGVSFYPADGDNVTALFKNADTAMYRAKALGKNRCQFFDAEMAVQATRRLGLETELRRGTPSQLFLLYQPQSDLSGGRIIGAEALVRWQHPDRGVVLPEDFIQVAEESGQMGRMGNWVLETACRQAGHWQRERGIPLRVAVNVSSSQLTDPLFTAAVGEMLRECRIDPALLELEFAETAVMCRTQETIRALHRLKDMGVSLALDNFGTGCASLLNLKKLPIDRLKIDRTFISEIQQSQENLDIVRMIIAMARSLRLQVSAVGVENESQLGILRSEGCDEFQGYLLAKPLAPYALEGLLESCRDSGPDSSEVPVQPPVGP